MFKRIKGQKRAITLLQRAIDTKKIASSYLFYGPTGVGKFTTALYFAMALNCNASHENRPCGYCNSCKKFLSFSHPDFVYIFPIPNYKISATGDIESGKSFDEYNNYLKNKIESPWREFYFSSNTEIRINSILMLEHHINLSPNEGRYKVYILEDFDRINHFAANAFLKTLEEPPNNSVIILTTTKPSALLPTILSRCQKIPFSALTANQIEKILIKNKFLDPIYAKLYARISNGNVEKALRLAEDNSIQTRDETIRFVELIIENDDKAFLEFVRNYTSSKNRKIVSDILAQLIIWLTDITYYIYDQQQIVNLDRIELMEKLYNLNPRAIDKVEKYIIFLENMQKRLARFVNPQLIFYETYFRFSELFHNIN